MVIAIVLLAFIVVLGVAALLGWTTDSRDPAYGLGRLHSAARSFRDFVVEQDEIQQRLMLINQPWREQFLHWSDCEHADGTGTPALHGHLVPPGRSPTSVTKQGWCSCGARRRPVRQARP